MRRGGPRGSDDAVVVGAGVVGLCAAEALVRDGWRVTIVDRGGRERDGASFGNAGLIVPSHVVPLAAPGVLGQGLRWMLDPSSPFYVQPRLDPELVRWGLAFVRASTRRRALAAAPVLRDLHLASRALHLDLAERVPGAPRVEERGLLMLCTSERGLEEEARLAARCGELGLRTEVLSATEVGSRLGVAAPAAVGGVHHLDDAHTSPRNLMRALQAHLEREGVRFVWGAEAEGVHLDGSAAAGVHLRGGGVVGGSCVVIAGGVSSPRLLRSVGVRLPMEAGRGYGVTVPDPAAPPAIPAILVEARVAVTPLAEGLRLGGTMELAAPDRPADPRRVRGILASVERALPAFRRSDLERLPVWIGVRPLSPDGMPYLGGLARVRGVVVATGHGMMGFSLGPVSGAIVADVAAGRPPRVASPLLAPERSSRLRRLAA